MRDGSIISDRSQTRPRPHGMLADVEAATYTMAVAVARWRLTRAERGLPQMPGAPLHQARFYGAPEKQNTGRCLRCSGMTVGVGALVTSIALGAWCSRMPIHEQLRAARRQHDRHHRRKLSDQSASKRVARAIDNSAKCTPRERRSRGIDANAARLGPRSRGSVGRSFRHALPRMTPWHIREPSSNGARLR